MVIYISSKASLFLRKKSILCHKGFQIPCFKFFKDCWLSAAFKSSSHLQFQGSKKWHTSRENQRERISVLVGCTIWIQYTSGLQCNFAASKDEIPKAAGTNVEELSDSNKRLWRSLTTDQLRNAGAPFCHKHLGFRVHPQVFISCYFGIWIVTHDLMRIDRGLPVTWAKDTEHTEYQEVNII